MIPESRRDGEEEFNPVYREVRFEYTPLLPEILQHLNVSLLVTTYQAGKLLVLGVHEGKMVISFLDYDQPMGLAISPQRLAIGTRRQMHFLVPAHETLRASPTTHNGCFVPRSSAYTGSIHGHDLAWGHDGLWVVNTLFSCLCTLHDQFSFVPRWRPPFISQLIDQDRCHLNGLAMVQGAPRFATAMAESDAPGGWRPTKATSGIVMEVPSGEILCRGLSMPHSPRVYQDRLWVLNSGHGSLGWVDPRSGNYETVEQFPGYTRGLAFAGQFAFVGLSKIRETSVFGGIPIAENRESLRCGIGVVDLVTGKTVAVFQFHSGVSEIFAVEVLPGVSNPMIAGSSVDQKEQDVWIVPPPNAPPPNQDKSLPLFAGPSTWINTGNMLQELNDQPGAMAAYRQALALDHQCVPALQNLGYLLFNRGLPEEASQCYEQLLQIAPSPMNQLLATCVLPVVYESAEDVVRWREKQRLRLQSMVEQGLRVDASRQLVPTGFFWAYQGENDREIMEWRGRLFATSEEKLPLASRLAILRQRVANRPNKKLRVGWISAYFRDHTIGRLNVGRIERLPRQSMEVVVAFAGNQSDPMVERFQKGADQFVVLERDVHNASRQLKALDLDILIFADVGMDALCSTLAHHRLAPIQAATWGHPDTTGSLCMDYFLSSELLETENAADHYSETLVRLANLGTYYERPAPIKTQLPRAFWGLPEEANLYICPQTLFKFHPSFDAILRDILARDPHGHLVLIDGRVPAWTEALRRRWSRTLGANVSRIQFVPAQAQPHFLQLLAAATVVLDTTHFGGGNTSYEALAMGVPIVTLPGPYLRSRITAALYHKMDWPKLIATNPSEYVDLAVRLATDAEFHREACSEIQKRSTHLFEDPEEVEALAKWLKSLAYES